MAFFTSCKQSEGGQRIYIAHRSGRSPTLVYKSHLVFTQFRVGPLDAFLLEPHGEEVRVGHHDTHQARLKRRRVRGKLAHAGAERKLADELRVHVPPWIHTCKLSPWTNIWATGSLRVYTVSIFSGAMYSPCASLKMCFFLSVIFRVPF